MAAMVDQGSRYDRIAEAYARWWAPVHRPATLALLDEIAPLVEGAPGRPGASGAITILDIGCGTGALLAAIVSRWPHVRVVGVDVSAGMLAVAERELAVLPEATRDRIELRQGAADRLPVADGSIDVAVSAFVYQLVPSRPRALRDARRTLRQGGTLAYVTWLAGGRFGADEIYDEALAAAGLEPEDRSADRDEPDRPEPLAAQLRRAGFAGAVARPGELDHRFTPEGYLAFIARFDDEDRFAMLTAEERSALETDLLARLRAAPPGDLRMCLPVAYVRGQRTRRG
jgi:SAM-dependent methyltransferase